MANKKRYYNNRSKKQNQESVIEQTAKFSQEQLALSTEDLGISEATRELLAKNRILTAADLVKRTEKDMYKVQGLNKKILFEVKDALKAKDMSLRPEPPKPKTDNVQNAKKSRVRTSTAIRNAKTIKSKILKNPKNSIVAQTMIQTQKPNARRNSGFRTGQARSRKTSKIKTLSKTTKDLKSPKNSPNL